MRVREGQSATALDVIENFLGSRPRDGDIARLGLDRIGELGGHLADLSEAQSFDAIETDAYHVGGWLAAHWSEPMLRAELSDSLLYYPSLVVLDPLADFFDDRHGLPATRVIRYRRGDGVLNSTTSGPRLWSKVGTIAELRVDPVLAAQRLAAIVRNLYDLEVPIRSGAVILRNQWEVIRRAAPALQASVRADVRSETMQRFIRDAEAAGARFQVWDNLRGGRVTMSGVVSAADKPWEFQHVAFYIAKTLAVADASDAVYVPAMAQDLELLRQKGRESVKGTHPTEFLAEVARLVVPTVEVPIREAAAIRASSQAFDDWRRELSALRRSASGLHDDVLRDAISDVLVPRIRAVKRELAASNPLRSADKALAEIVFATVGAAALSAGTGASPAQAVVASAGSGVARWVWKAYLSHQQHGVLGMLIRSESAKNGVSHP